MANSHGVDRGGAGGAITSGDIAIVIVNFNGGDLLLRCLDALAKQTVIPGCIIVVDNHSQDESPHVIRRRYPKVTLVQLDRNQGFAAATNRGIEHASRFRWIASLNPDAFPEENWVAALVDAVNRHHDCACFGCRMIDDGDRSRIDGTGDTYHVSGLAWRTDHGKSVDTVSDQVREIFSPCAAAALYDRQVLLDVGGFDETFFCYFEDVDLGFRLRLAGYRCLHVGTAVVYHVGSGLTGRNSDFSIYHGHRNLVWSYFKNMPTRLLWHYLLQHLLLNIATLLFYGFTGRFSVIARSKIDAIRGLPAMLQERRRVQSLRRVRNRDLRGLMVRGFWKPYIGRHV